MKIVKISDLSEEERKKALEEQEQRYQENEINREKENKRVKEAFESNIAPIAERGYISNNQGANSERNKINEEFSKKNTQNINDKKQIDNKSKVSYLLTTASQKKEIENAKEIKFGDMYKLTNGKVDDRNYFQKIGDKLDFLSLNTAGGALAGTTGIAQAGLTDSANEMNKGKEKENTELGFNFIDSLLGLINPTYGATKSIENAPDKIKEIIDTLQNKDKSTTEKITDIGLNATDNAINDTPVKNLFNSTNQIIGKINPNLSEAILEVNNKISQPSKQIQEKLNKEAENQDEATRFLGNAFKSVGNMLPSVATSVFTGSPTTGLAVMGASAKGQSTQEALDRGADLDKAVKIGNTKAMIEIGTEMMSGGLNIFGKGALDDIVTKGIDKKVKNEVANFLLKKGVDIPGEILEETISDILGTIIDKGTIDPSATYSISDWSDTALTTTLSTVILNDLTGGYGKNAYRANQINMQDGNSGIYTDYNTGNVLDKKTQGILKQAENIIKENNILPMAREFENKTDNLRKQQTIQQENKTGQNQMSEQIQIDTENFSKQIDNVQNIKENNDLVVLSSTPQIYKELGLDDLPMTITKNHTIWAMTEKSDANSHLHGLNKEIVKQIPEALTRPLNVVESGSKSGSIVVITELADNDGNLVIVPIKVNGKANVNEIEIDSNVLTSIYGKDNDYDKWMKKNIENSRVLYDIDEGIIKKYRGNPPRLQLSNDITSIDSTESIINNSITSSNENVKPTNYSMQNKSNNTQNIAPTTENNSLPTAQQTNTTLDVGEYAGKQRKHYKSIIQSQETTPQAKKIAKELLKSDTYVPETNKAQLEQADARIMSSTPDSELSSLSSKALNGEKVTSVDIAVGERLIQYYSKTGDAVKLQEAIQTTAMAGTTAGQTVQAMSLLNHQTPQGQAMWLQKSVDKMNKELAQRKGGTIKKVEDGSTRIVNKKGVDITDKVDLFNLTPEMTQKIVNSKNATELQTNLNEVYEQLGQQVTKTTIQKLDSWRYFAMLANPRTHIRNIVGNSAMGTMQYGIKNKVAGAIEGIVSQFNPDMERTHTIFPASEEVKQFAKSDIVNVLDRLELTENKYNPKTRLENSMRTFKSDVMENTIGKLFELNDTALEAEDGWGLKAGYKKALADYMTANKLTPENITDKQLAKARNYAVEQAKEATFHQQNEIASLINQLSNKNQFSKFATDAILPFKKTPMNIAKLGVEYSPVGLAKSMVYDTIQLRKKNITINKYIDNVSKGLTGTGIALVGYALAESGVLKASGSDDKDKENYAEAQGNQTYSVKIGDNTYSLDWIAPSGIPLFIGAEIYEIMQSKNETKSSSSDDDKAINQAIKSAVNIMDGFTNAMNPMTEMSMLSGLTSALQSYQQGSSQMLANMGTNAVKSYVNQYVPTALGQIAKTTDEYERSTSTTKTGILPKATESTKNQIMSKIPGVRQTLPKKTDTWGNDMKQPENIVQRALENAVLPYTRKSIATSNVDKEIEKVYQNTGESSVLPDSINKYLTIDKQKYIMTSEEYAKYKKTYGQSSYNLLNNLVSSTEYKKLNDSQKQVAIEKAYEYSKEQIKIDYAKNNDLEYEESKLSKTINILKKSNANTSNYLEYLALTKDMDKDSEKLEILSNSKFTDKTKQLIYENNIKSSTDKKYDIVKSSGLNINEYLKYKLEDSNKSFSSDKKDDGTIKGKAITNSAKTKKYNYINSMNGTYTQKAILFGLESTPTKTDKQTIVNYITSLPGKSKQEKLDMLGEFSWVTLYKDGTFNY